MRQNCEFNRFVLPVCQPHAILTGVESLPAKFGRYELIELLATGGMAHIFRARLLTAEGMTKELVIKRVLPNLIQDREFIDLFINEARVSMPLTHGNIVQVFEFGQEKANYFLAMEYVRGRNLETVLHTLQHQGENMPVPVALFIGSEVAKGLDYAHRFRDPHNRPTGIIHRDVSPQNILVGFQGEIKLTDFGIAKAYSRLNQSIQDKIRGKAVYLSPEQVASKHVDARSDQFSLGTVMHEMLTGKRVFEGPSDPETIKNIRGLATPRPSLRNREVSVSVDESVIKALAKNPHNRFKSCGAFQVALSRSLSELAPEFTSAHLAGWMSRLFADEMDQDAGAHAHLSAQMAGASDRSSFSTNEMLELSTHAIAPDNSLPEKHGFRWSLLLMPLFVLLIGVFAWLASDGPTGKQTQLKDPSTHRKAHHPLNPTPKGLPLEKGKTPAPDRPKKPQRTIQRPKKIRFGYLNLNSSPWALVEIDGKRLPKETPLFKVKIRAGKHRLRFFNPELKIEKVRVVRVKPNQTQTISVRLQAPLSL
jgi:serine/threonine-protein kinase